MKKRLILFSLVLSIIETVCLFVPYSFKEEVWRYDPSAIVYHGISTLQFEENVNILGISTVIGRILEILVVVFMILSIIVYFQKLLQKDNKLSKKYVLISIVSFALLVVFAFYAYAFAEYDTTNWRYEWTINWLFYIIIVLHILTIVFAFLIKSKNFDETTMKNEKANNYSSNNDFSAAEEIKKYKELLDSGVINQEEYEAKKRQLLGL